MIDRTLSEISSETVQAAGHFNQNEEFFLQLASPFSVRSMPIHHDVTDESPEPGYLETLRDALVQLTGTIPGVFKDVAYFFDPTDTLRPRFHRLCCEGDARFLYLLRVDLGYRAQECELLERGSNDRTPGYRSSRLFTDALLVPLAGGPRQGALEAEVLQAFSETWLGERGRGYFVQGIWIDHDLTRFLSKLFLPAGQLTYPFYPFVCRYRTVCATVVDPAPGSRLSMLPYLRMALEFLTPAAGEIERSLKTAAFSEDLPVFRKLKRSLPPAWGSFCRGLRVLPYLNDHDMREFRLESADA